MWSAPAEQPTCRTRRRVDVEAASRLRLTGDAVHTVVFSRPRNDIPFCVTTVHLPSRVGEALAGEPTLTAAGSTSATTAIATVDTRFPVAEAEQSITAVLATPPATTLLDCSAGDPLLRVDRTYHSARGEPVELAISYFLPQHYSYRVHLRRADRGHRAPVTRRSRFRPALPAPGGTGRTGPWRRTSS